MYGDLLAQYSVVNFELLPSLQNNMEAHCRGSPDPNLAISRKLKTNYRIVRSGLQSGLISGSACGELHGICRHVAVDVPSHSRSSNFQMQVWWGAPVLTDTDFAL